MAEYRSGHAQRDLIGGKGEGAGLSKALPLDESCLRSCHSHTHAFFRAILNPTYDPRFGLKLHYAIPAHKQERHMPKPSANHKAESVPPTPLIKMAMITYT